ncbi:hypothetical protein [Rhodococcus xishaensis]|uniref:Uncharacterized protein n=1 Tax=Rhodococcus xishaensis TaxID=2487364 RepID=A0A3S3A674_9NOCA|nr:hypothetical protein [Rhodococcus xishaensis]RVW03000.1 hypothetical protein EGT50_09830 [Rhodococcus xishaensis]
MPTATLVVVEVPGFAGPAQCYKLSAPLRDRTQNRSHDYVTVFTTNGFGAPETIIVPARPSGAAVVMNRLAGSMVGIADPAGALWAAGGFEHGQPYEVVTAEPEPEPEAEFEPEPDA